MLLMRALVLSSLLLGLLVSLLALALPSPEAPEEEPAAAAPTPAPRAPASLARRAHRDHELWRIVRGEVRHAPMKATRPATIQGEVLDSAGVPLANARVQIRSSGANHDRETHTSEDGDFTFEAVEPGVVHLYTESTFEDASARERLVLLPGQVGHVRLVTDLQDQHQVEGDVLDSAGRALAQVWIGVLDPEAGPARPGAVLLGGHDTTFIGGSFRIRLPAPGRYRAQLRVRQQSGRLLAEVPLEVRRGSSRHLIRLTEKGVSCSLRDRRGRLVPFSNYSLSWHLPGGGAGGIGVGGFSSGAYERFTFPWPGPGYRLSVRLSGEAGREVEGTLELDGPGRPCRVVEVR